MTTNLHSAAELPRAPSVGIEITSDFVCPWCFIGERRLHSARARLPDIAVDVTWRPFQLNPWVPERGMSRRDYRVFKFGSWERSLDLDAQVAVAGGLDGLQFRFGRVKRIPNTFELHRLMQLAKRVGNPDEFAVKLMTAYFSEGIDLSDPAEIVAVAAQAGLPAARVQSVLRSDTFASEVRALESAARDDGVEAIPTFRIGAEVVTGAPSIAVLVAKIRNAAVARTMA